MFLKFSSGADFGFTIFSGILFPINYPVASARLWNTSLESVFAAFSPVSVTVFNNIPPYLLDRFLPNDKTSYA